ncbi:hypothetical protein VNO78_17746 [Psophocarpus tetragonolobus]|uniref:RING-type E3 ubiquitin transferase n=1 Tax=Psophocarpus tetragonolobus TaxID=3891 RepID=A0AAN9SNR2_PSOTE
MDAKAVMSSYVRPLVISAAGVICSTIAIAVYHCILLRYFVRPQRPQPSRNNLNNTTIKTNDGVQQDILNKIPVFSISTRTRDIHLDHNECAICLGQWEDADVVRLLPSCKHVFHRPCIDTWFMNHANCPVCRSPITYDSELPPPPLPMENSPHHPFTNVNDDVSGSTPMFQRPRPMLHHTLSLSSHMRRKSRGLVLGTLKRSLSLDQTSSYIAITIQGDHGGASSSSNSSSSSSSSSSRGVLISQYNYRSRSRMPSLLLRSFSQFRSNTSSGTYNAILPY